MVHCVYYNNITDSDAYDNRRQCQRQEVIKESYTAHYAVASSVTYE